MTTSQIKAIFRNNETVDEIPEMHSIVDIAQQVKIDIKMDNENNTYYYIINVLDLSKSNISDEAIQGLLSSGWTLDKKQENIVKMC